MAAETEKKEDGAAAETASPDDPSATGAPSTDREPPAGGESEPPPTRYEPPAASPPESPASATRRESSVFRFVRRRATPLVFLGALLLLLPGLGYGLWDPWETHYAEVARRITTDGDWVTLHWGNADSDPAEMRKLPRDEQAEQRFLFFSKPILAFWLMALSFLAFGATEFAARLPMVLLAAGGVAAAFFYLRRLVGDRAALLSSVLLLLTPMWAMLGRHAMTDIPFVAPAMVGTLAFATVLLDEATDPRHAYVGYVCLALATLAKGLLGFLLPGAALLAMLFVTGDLRSIRTGGTDLGAGLDALGEWLGGAARRVRRRGPMPAARRELWVWLSVAASCAALVMGAAVLARWRFGPPGLRWGALLAGALVAVVAAEESGQPNAAGKFGSPW